MNTLNDKQLCDLISLIADKSAHCCTPSKYFISEWLLDNHIEISDNVKEHILDVLHAVYKNK